MQNQEATQKNTSPVTSPKQELAKKNDFVEIKFTGYANGEVFDSNIEEDLKKLHQDAKPERMIIVVGEGMVVLGLDKALEGKELKKEYEVTMSQNEGFGTRDRNLIRTLPLASFTEQKVNPQPGMVLALNNQAVKIIAVSGARVTADFNNPLAGKEIKYKFTITKKITDKKEKAETLIKFFFRFLPEHEIKEDKTIIKLPKGLESMVNLYKEKFKALTEMNLEFEELKKPEEKKSNSDAPSQNKGSEQK